MITHVVLFKFKSETTAAEIQQLAEGLGNLPRRQIDALTDLSKTFGAKGLAYIVINDDGTYKSSIAKFFTEEDLAEIVKALDGKPGDLL